MVPVGNSLPILEDLVSFWATQQVVASFLRVLWVGDVWLLEVGFVGVLFVNTNHFTKQKQINCQKIQKLAVGCDAIQSLSFCNFCYLKRCETFACFSPFFFFKKPQESVLQEEIPELDALMRGVFSASDSPTSWNFVCLVARCMALVMIKMDAPKQHPFGRVAAWICFLLVFGACCLEFPLEEISLKELFWWCRPDLWKWYPRRFEKTHWSARKNTCRRGDWQQDESKWERSTKNNPKSPD